MIFDIQPTALKNEIITLMPMAANNFEAMYSVASDPLIWKQHPNKNLYQRDVFEIFFEDTILSIEHLWNMIPQLKN